MASPLVGISAVNALLFGAYATAKKAISYQPVLTLPQTALAGAMAGAGNSLLASPVELFKIRMQGQYGGAADQKLGAILNEMYSKYGLRHGVMRGFWITVMREMPAYAGFYTAYEFSKRRLHRSLYGPQASSDVQLPVWATLLAGSTGGIAYWTACYPFGKWDELRTALKQLTFLCCRRCQEPCSEHDDTAEGTWLHCRYVQSNLQGRRGGCLRQRHRTDVYVSVPRLSYSKLTRRPRIDLRTYVRELQAKTSEILTVCLVDDRIPAAASTVNTISRLCQTNS